MLTLFIEGHGSAIDNQLRKLQGNLLPPFHHLPFGELPRGGQRGTRASWERHRWTSQLTSGSAGLVGPLLPAVWAQPVGLHGAGGTLQKHHGKGRALGRSWLSFGEGLAPAA